MADVSGVPSMLNKITRRPTHFGMFSPRAPSSKSFSYKSLADDRHWIQRDCTGHCPLYEAG